MTKNAISTVLLVIVVALAARWVLDTLKGESVQWLDGLVVAIAGAIGALVGLYWREKTVR